MVEKTKLTHANTTHSLRTTIPMSIIKQFELDEHSEIEWSVKAKNNQLIIFVKPIVGER